MLTGENKKELVKKLFSYNSFDPAFPLSIIHHKAVSKKTSIFISKDASNNAIF